MFCPKCGVKNLEDAKFCRACGADIHLVPRALAGAVPWAPAAKKKEAPKEKEPPTLEKGFENVFGGIACLVIFVLGLTYFQGYFWISVWFIFPGLGHIGKGIGQIIHSRQEPRALGDAPTTDALDSARLDALPAAAPDAPDALDAHAAPPAPDAIPGAPTNEITPPSVTESTTRRLGARRRSTA